ncbi:MAG: aminopeptidase P family protein [Actinomycetota bacterium]|nr:aminopeptidase P family protein [Actinomycetota bacterium]
MVGGSDSMVTIGSQLDRRRQTVAEQWNLTNEVVLIAAGPPIPIPGRGDITYPFRAHSEYFYLTDRERPGGVLAFVPEEGWVDFVAPVTQDERLWEGAPLETEAGAVVSELGAWLQERSGRRIASLGAPLPDIAPDSDFTAEARRVLNRVRRQKDPVELERMRAAESATSGGFAAIGSLLEPGRTEREIQIELEAEFFRNGADALAFDTIVGGGTNSAVLHFAPTRRPFQPGELVLIDAGGEVHGYASDETRTYPVSGGFTAAQEELYALVRSACQTAIDLCRPGMEFPEIHLTAATVIAEGLAQFGLLRGQPDVLVDNGAVSVFFPHGIGHMVGLGVRDAGELLHTGQGNSEVVAKLRIDLALLPGYAVTIEPGIYFVPALLHDPELRERHRESVDRDQAEEMIDFGGIRIEQNVLITEDACEVLTADIPIL